jgi:hypothetical protein
MAKPYYPDAATKAKGMRYDFEGALGVCPTETNTADHRLCHAFQRRRKLPRRFRMSKRLLALNQTLRCMRRAIVLTDEAWLGQTGV